MFWEIIAWAAVALLTVFRVALVYGVVAVVDMIVRSLRAPKQPCGRRRACAQVARASPEPRFPAQGPGRILDVLRGRAQRTRSEVTAAAA